MPPALFVATETGTVRAFLLDDFSSEWTETVPEAKLYGPLVLQDNLLMVGVVSRGVDVAAFDVDNGQLRWTFKPASR